MIASQKGGCAKSTLVLNLAVAAEQAGIGPVVLLDTDPQGTLTKWWRKREADVPALAVTPISGLSSKLAALRDAGYTLAVIDTPPAITSSIRAVIELGDLVLIPVQPSPADLWAVGETIDLARECGRAYAFVLTRATKSTTMTKTGMVALAIHGDIAGIMTNRVAYAESLLTGQSVHESQPKGTAAGEISVLLAFLKARLLASQIARMKVVV